MGTKIGQIIKLACKLFRRMTYFLKTGKQILCLLVHQGKTNSLIRQSYKFFPNVKNHYI